MASYTPKTTGQGVAQDNAHAIRGKVILVTGVTPGGLGARFAEVIAKHQPKLIILAGRNVEQAGKTAAAVEAAGPGVATRVLKLDLSSQQQVREAGKEVNAYEEAIDVLVNNAGIMAAPYTKTQDGLESQLGTNHIGHWLFTRLIIDKILASPHPRIVNVSSDGHRFSPIRWYDYNFDDGKTYNRWRAYGQAKTANMLFSTALAKKYGAKGLLAFSLHPGVIFTNLTRHLSAEMQEDFAEMKSIDKMMGHERGWTEVTIKSLDEGTATHVYGAFDASIAAHNGAYLSDSAVVPPKRVSPWARDEFEAEHLWELSETLTGEQWTV
ncbi:MAG: hypothetical protein M1818_003571 [Claussenomyces sp. TS43310]|nr:MAG: hypothetical protein M1818_003571 [Claussenomyces sp. TS43310]